MGRTLSIAFWSYVTPLMATRGLRIGALLAGLFLAGIFLLFMIGAVSRDFQELALHGARHFLITVGLPAAAVLTSEMSLRDGITHRTLLYPLLGPVSRIELAIVRTAVTGLLLGLGVSLLLLVTRILLGDGMGFLPREILAMMLGAMAYTGMFGLLHVLHRRGLVTGLVILFFFDLPLGKVPFSIRNLSPSNHVGVIANQRESFPLPIQLNFSEGSVAVSAFVLAVLAVGSIALTAWAFRRKNLGDVC